MRRILSLTFLALTLAGGVALADRHHDRGGRGERDHRGPVVRDDRRSEHRGPVVRDHRWDERQPRREQHRSYRQPVYANNGRFHFRNGYSYNYVRPTFHHRYYDYRYRPQLIVESYQPVTGYVWVAGQWQWNGYEWLWVSGHYADDPSYLEPGY